MFSGEWRVDNAQSTSQQSLLRAMGKPSWQIGLVDKASETFVLRHSTGNVNGKIVHTFEKDVLIYLDSVVLAMLSFIIPVNQVKYQHTFHADGHKQHHADDAKGFGECESLTTWDAKTQTFTIRWFLHNGILKAIHDLPSDTVLRMRNEFTNARGETFHATKVYVRSKAKA
jgi:hypothetical protein